jgi:hypothetical protein
LDEFATLATNLLAFLVHDVTSHVRPRAAQSKRLSWALVSEAVGQSAVFFRFFADVLGSSRRMPNGVGIGGAAIGSGKSSTGADSCSGSGSTSAGRGCAFSRSLSSSRHYSESETMPSELLLPSKHETQFFSKNAVQLELFG